MFREVLWVFREFWERGPELGAFPNPTRRKPINFLPYAERIELYLNFLPHQHSLARRGASLVLRPSERGGLQRSMSRFFGRRARPSAPQGPAEEPVAGRLEA